MQENLEQIKIDDLKKEIKNLEYKRDGLKHLIEEDLATKKAQDEILANNRKDALKAFTDKSYAIQTEIKKYEENLKNIQIIYDEHFSTKTEEIKGIERQLRDKLSKASSDQMAASTALAEAEKKLLNATAIEKELQESLENHKSNLNKHTSNVDLTNKDLAQRGAKCVAMEEESKAKLIESTRGLELALEQEKRIEEEAAKLIHISQNTNEDIVKLNDLRQKTNLLIEELEQKKSALIADQNKINESRAENEKLRMDLDNTILRLSQRKQELDDKEKKNKIDAINNESRTLQLKSQEDAINLKLGKLSNLEERVNALIEKKEKVV